MSKKLRFLLLVVFVFGLFATADAEGMISLDKIIDEIGFESNVDLVVSTVNIDYQKSNDITRMSENGNGNVVFVRQDIPEEGKGKIKGAIIMMQDENHDIVDPVQISSTRGIGGYGYGWPGEVVSGTMWLQFEFTYEEGLDGNLYYVPTYLSAEYDSSSVVRSFVAGYQIKGAKYEYDACLNVPNLSAVSSNSAIKLNISKDNPVNGDTYEDTTPSEYNRAISSINADGEWGIGYVLSDGTKWSRTTRTIPDGTDYTMQ